jgi:hypothetical protein
VPIPLLRPLPCVSRVGEGDCSPSPLSEPCLRLSPHTAQASENVSRRRGGETQASPPSRYRFGAESRCRSLLPVPCHQFPATSSLGAGGGTSQYRLDRHLRSHLIRLVKLSRDQRPVGSRRPFEPREASCIHPITGRRLLSPTSFTRTAVARPYNLATRWACAR